jgi:hypothetical protein
MAKSRAGWPEIVFTALADLMAANALASGEAGVRLRIPLPAL